MGQRHQVFIHVENRNITSKEDKLIFGTKKTVTLAYHNQWLYGRSALFECAKVLAFANMKDDIYHALDAYNTKELAENIKMVLRVNQQYHGGSKGVGFHYYSFLNTEYPSMGDCIDREDNNDGVTIIDTINKKYCFMAFCGLECDENARDTIKDYVPLSAEDYVLAYYPDKKANWHTPPTDLSEIINEAIDGLSSYQVLTMDELRVMFPLQKEFQK